MTWPATQSGTDMDQPGLCQGGLAWISKKEEDLHSNKGRGRKKVRICVMFWSRKAKYTIVQFVLCTKMSQPLVDEFCEINGDTSLLI